jgi:hypothetical protein
MFKAYVTGEMVNINNMKPPGWMIGKAGMKIMYILQYTVIN